MSVPGKTEHGFFHSIKEKLFHGEKHVDSEWEAAYTQYSRLSDSLLKLKSSAVNYSTSLNSALFSSNAVAVEFAALLEDPVQETGYETLSKQHLQAHQALGTERQNALAQRLAEQVLQPLDKIIQGYLDLNGRIAKRNEMHVNFEYYLSKMSSLTKERDERGAKGKPESSSQREKLERNQVKLEAARTEYQGFTQPLIADLHAAWNNRSVALGPILTAFASIEKEFVQVYGSQIEQVHPEMVGVGKIMPQQSLGASAPLPVVSPMPLGVASSPAAVATAVGPAAASATLGTTPQPAIITTTSVTALTPNPSGDATVGNIDSGAGSLASTGSNAGITNTGLAGVGRGESDVFGEVNNASQQMPSQQYGGVQQQQYGISQQQQYGIPQQQQYGMVQPDQQYGTVLAQPQQQQALAGNPFEQQSAANPFEQQSRQPVDVASGSSLEGVNQGGVSLGQSLDAAASLPPIEQRHDPVGGAQPQPELAGPGKSSFEDESKRQRFEEDNKQANIIGV